MYRPTAGRTSIAGQFTGSAWQVDAAVAKVPLLRMEIVKRSDDTRGFVVLPRR
jgi:hypothetical protein